MALSHTLHLVSHVFSKEKQIQFQFSLHHFFHPSAGVLNNHDSVNKSLYNVYIFFLNAGPPTNAYQALWILWGTLCQ